MPNSGPSRRTRLISMVVMLVSSVGCSTTPPLITEIGDAVDRGAQKVTEAFDGRSLPPPQDSEEEAVTRAREAYDAGKLAYQTAQYLEALEKFFESFAAAEEIEDPEIKAQVQSSLYYNLGATQLRAHEIDGDPTRLPKAKALLQNYLDSDPELTEEERAQAQGLMDEADQKRAEVEGTDEADEAEDAQAEAAEAP